MTIVTTWLILPRCLIRSFKIHCLSHHLPHTETCYPGTTCCLIRYLITSWIHHFLLLLPAIMHHLILLMMRIQVHHVHQHLTPMMVQDTQQHIWRKRINCSLVRSMIQTPIWIFIPLKLLIVQSQRDQVFLPKWKVLPCRCCYLNCYSKIGRSYTFGTKLEGCYVTRVWGTSEKWYMDLS